MLGMKAWPESADFFQAKTSQTHFAGKGGQRQHGNPGR